MSTIESSDDATLSKGDFSVCGSNWSASDKSTSRRSSSFRDGIGTYNNPYGTNSHTTSVNNNESTTESIMRVLREAGVTRFISDICCDSTTNGINEPETQSLDDANTFHKNGSNFHFNNVGENRHHGKYAHECESVDTQDSLLRRQSLLSNNRRPNNPVNVLEVQHKRKPRGTHRSQTAPRQRADSLQEPSFNTVSPYSTFTPRADGSGMGTTQGVMHRKFTSNGNLAGMGNDNNNSNNNNDTGSISSRSTLTRRSKESLRSRERHSFTTRYSMSSNHEELPLPPRNPGRQRRGSSNKCNNARK